MATLHYAEAWTKATTDTPFRNRLRVALTRHAQYQLQRPQGGSETEARYDALQNLARTTLAKVREGDWLTSAALYALLPWYEGSWNPEDDEALDARIATIFPDLGTGPVPA